MGQTTGAAQRRGACHGQINSPRQAHGSDNSVAIKNGILINLGMYESMIAEALHTGIVVFYLSGLLSLLAGLAIVNLQMLWCGGAGACQLAQFLAR